MADDVYKILGSVIDLWKLPTTGDNEYVDTTEFWLSHATNKVKVSSRRIAPEERVAWLDERTQGAGENAKSLLARFVWVEASDADNSISLSQSVQHDILEKFGLTVAHHYFKSTLSGINALPRVSEPRADRRSYAFCFGPKRAAIWSQTIRKDVAAEPVTEGFLFLRALPKSTASEDNMKGGTALQFQKLIQSAPWSPDVCRSSAFPAYLNALVLSKEITQTVAERGSQIRNIENQTGFHEYQGRDAPFENVELHEESARASGISTKLASVTRKTTMVEKLLDFVDRMVDEDKTHLRTIVLPDGSSPPTETHGQLLRSNVAVLRQRLEMQAAETEYAQNRVQTQINVLFNLIAFREAMENTLLSGDMRQISLTTQRDAASMKTLAYVTMFFLPGSFISALFSTPLFTWDNVDVTDRSTMGVGTTPQFRLYWAVTVPLTVVTFLLYFLWLWWQHRQRKILAAQAAKTGKRSAVKMPELEGATKAKVAENGIIARKRQATVAADQNGIPMTASTTWRSTFRTWGKDQDHYV